MRHEFFHKAGKLDRIIYDRDVVMSVGKNNYVRLEVKNPTAATLGRLEKLVRSNYGSRPTAGTPGVVYRDFGAFMAAVWRTHRMARTAKKLAAKRRKQDRRL